MVIVFFCLDSIRIFNLIDLPSGLRAIAVDKVGCPHQLSRRRDDIRIIIGAAAFRKVGACKVDLQLMEFIRTVRIRLAYIGKIVF